MICVFLFFCKTQSRCSFLGIHDTIVQKLEGTRQTHVLRTATPDREQSFGIEQVFINGRLVLDHDELNETALHTAGRAIRIR